MKDEIIEKFNSLRGDTKKLYQLHEYIVFWLHQADIIYLNGDKHRAISILNKCLEEIKYSSIENIKNEILTKLLIKKGNLIRDIGTPQNIKAAINIYKNAAIIKNTNNYLTAQIQFYLGACFEMKKDLKSSFVHYKAGSEAIESNNYNLVLKSNIQTRIGCIYTKEGHFTRAERQLIKAKRIRSYDRINPNTDFIDNKLSIIDLCNGNLDKAYYDVDSRLGDTKSKLFIIQSNILLIDILLNANELDSAIDFSVDVETMCLKHQYLHQLNILRNKINII